MARNNRNQQPNLDGFGGQDDPIAEWLRLQGIEPDPFSSAGPSAQMSIPSHLPPEWPGVPNVTAQELDALYAHYPPSSLRNVSAQPSGYTPRSYGLGTGPVPQQVPQMSSFVTPSQLSLNYNPQYHARSPASPISPISPYGSYPYAPGQPSPPYQQSGQVPMSHGSALPGGSAVDPTQYLQSQISMAGMAAYRNPRSPSELPSPSSGGSDDEGDDTEERRARNTDASARFRRRKKERTAKLAQTVATLEQRAGNLEREAKDLRQENTWLKEIVMLKAQAGEPSPSGRPDTTKQGQEIGRGVARPDSNNGRKRLG